MILPLILFPSTAAYASDSALGPDPNLDQNRGRSQAEHCPDNHLCYPNVAQSFQNDPIQIAPNGSVQSPSTDSKPTAK